MKVMLINPSIGFKRLYGEWDMSDVKSSSPPLGLLSIAAFIRKYGYEVKIIDAQVDGFSLKVVEAFQPDVVGLTAMTLQVSSAAEIARVIKQVYPRMSIVLGGVHATAEPQATLLRYPQFNCVFVGEGERDFLHYLGRDGEFNCLDDLPYPAYDLVDLSKYRLSVMGTKHFKSIGLVTSRGCFAKCTFCCRKVFGDRLRVNSAQYVVDELKYLNTVYGVSDFLFYDDLFVGHHRRLREFCQMILDQQLPFTWSCCSRCDTMSPELLQLMKRAGCWMIEYGIESGSQKVLDLMRKGIKKEQVVRVIADTHNAGIVSKGNFILGNFGETRETLQETIDFVCELKLNYFQHTFLAPLPGTEAWERASEFGEFTPSWDRVNTFAVGFIPSGLTAEDLHNYSKRMWRRFYLRPHILWQELRKLHTLEDIYRLWLAFKAFIKTVVQ